MAEENEVTEEDGNSVDPETQKVSDLLNDKEFCALVDRLIEEDYSADNVADAFMHLDILEAGDDPASDEEPEDSDD